MSRWRRWVLLGLVVGGCGEEAPAGGAVAGAAAVPSASAVASAAGGGAEAGGDGAGGDTRCPEARVPLAERMGGTLAELCETAATVDPMRLDPSLDLSLSGTWKGEYVGEETGASPTRFDASLSVFAGVVIGTTTEPNTFGGYGYSELEAGLTGDAYATRQVVMLKTYRSGGTTHSVLYVGKLDGAGRRIEGQWRVSNGTRGTFWMERS